MKDKTLKKYMSLFLILSVIVVIFLDGCISDDLDNTYDISNDRITITINDSSPSVIQKSENEDTTTNITNPNISEESVESVSESEISDENIVPGSVENIRFDPNWEYADYSVINSGDAKLYRASNDRRDIVIGINAGHGTKGGQKVKTYCHPDKSAKVTGGTTAAGSIKAPAVSGGMTFSDGTSEAKVTLNLAKHLKEKLLAEGYDVLMLRDEDDVQLDNIARTVIANNTAECLISLHWDGDNLSYDKGCFYISTPDGIKDMDPVTEHWKDHHELGDALIDGLRERGCKIYQNGSMSIDLTQTSYSCIPSIDLELGNQSSAHDDETMSMLADGIVMGIKKLF